MKPSRRTALIAAAVVLSVNACGDATQSDSSDATTPTVERSAPAVIEVASATATRMAAPESGADGLATTDSADSKMMFAPMVFTFEGDLPALDGDAPSWFFPEGNEATADQVRTIAAAFGLTGGPTALPADQGGGWLVGSVDDTGPSLTVSSSTMLDWWFNPGPTTPAAMSGCAVAAVLPAETEPPSDTVGVVVEDTSAPVICEEPPPLVGVPTAEEAEATAREFLSAAGHDLSAYEFESSADDWGAYVTGSLVLEGHRTPVTVSVGFGAEGALTWASGALAVPQPGAAYPRRGAAAGLQELQDQQNEWMGGVGDSAGVKSEIMPIDECALVTDTPMPATSSGDTGASIDPAAPADTTVTEPAPEITTGIVPICGPGTGPVDPIEVVLAGVEEDLTMVWASDGTIWLLPAYTFTSTDGGRFTVVAVDEQFLSSPAG